MYVFREPGILPPSASHRETHVLAARRGPLGFLKIQTSHYGCTSLDLIFVEILISSDLLQDSKKFLIIEKKFLAVSHGIWDFSSLIRDQT